MGGERNRPKAAGEERIRVLCAAQRWSIFCCTFRHIIRAIWKEVQNPTGMCFGRRSSRKPDVPGSAAAPADVGTQHSSTAAARQHGRDQQAPAQELCSLGTAQPNFPVPNLQFQAVWAGLAHQPGIGTPRNTNVEPPGARVTVPLHIHSHHHLRP